ncbi:MAG: hypothetical protein FWE44_02070 [Defluviitaleaceae bacterium]|nr:hypothetical protein [Defluviitaleaceae bacterium]
MFGLANNVDCKDLNNNVGEAEILLRPLFLNGGDFMKLFWLKIKTSISLFMEGRKKLFKRLYWTLAMLLLAFIIIMPIYTGIIGVYDPMTTPASMRLTHEELQEIREIEGNLMAYWREASRNHDFAYMMWLLEENFPFFELSLRQGTDITELAIEAFSYLADHVRYDISPNFLLNFINDNFSSRLNGLGQMRLAASVGSVTPWLTEPYYMGYVDSRFANPNIYIPTNESNFFTQMLSQNVAHIEIDSFLQKGYAPLTNMPFWHYNVSTERLLLNSFFRNLDADHLIIDIRGHSEGFGEYFLPMLLEPNLRYILETNFFAFHTTGDFAMGVSSVFRNYHGLGDLVSASSLAAELPWVDWRDFEHLTHGFEIPMLATPSLNEPAFNGKIWLLTDSCNFSGPNQIYLQLAQMAGFTILYAENPESMGWPVSFTSLPNSGLLLRHNPLYFTDERGLSLEEFVIVPHVNLDVNTNDGLVAAYSHITGNILQLP